MTVTVTPFPVLAAMHYLYHAAWRHEVIDKSQAGAHGRRTAYRATLGATLSPATSLTFAPKLASSAADQKQQIASLKEQGVVGEEEFRCPSGPIPQTAST